MTVTTKNEAALSAKRLAPIFRGIVAAMKGGEDTTARFAAENVDHRRKIEEHQTAINANKAGIAKAHATVSEGIFGLLAKLPAISETQWTQDCSAVCRAQLEAAGYAKGTVAVRLSNMRAAVLCFTNGKVKRLPQEAFQPYASRCARHLAGTGQGNAKGAGRKPRPANNKRKAGTVAEVTPMQHAMALCGDNVGRAKALIVILKEHVEAFDTFAAGVLSK